LLSRNASLFTRRELFALVIAFVASLPAVTARLYSSDEVEYFSYLRSLWFDHDVSFENEYQYFYDHDIAQSEGFHETFLERRTGAGRRVNYATMGCAILWAPFYGAADAIVRLARAAGHEIPADGYSKPYIAAIAYGSAVYGFAAVLLSIAAGRAIVGRGALVGGTAVWLGTPLLFYMYVAPPFSHACSAFSVALFVTIWLHVRQQWSVRGTAVLGASAALMTMVREQDVFFAIGPAADFLLTFTADVRARRQSTWNHLSAAAAGILAFVVTATPQLLAYTALNGYPGPASDVRRKMFWYAPHGLQVLASPAHGLLAWTPLAALSIAGLILLTIGTQRDTRRIGGCALLMVLFQAYVAGSVESWTVAGGFGQRRFVALTILLAIGLASLWCRAAPSPTGVGSRRHPVRLWALGAALAVCVWWNIGLSAAFALKLMDRQRVEPARNAYAVFVTLPRMVPDLAYRYLFDRQSFYQRGGETH
jgi:hypothetical protein